MANHFDCIADESIIRGYHQCNSTSELLRLLGSSGNRGDRNNLSKRLEGLGLDPKVLADRGKAFASKSLASARPKELAYSTIFSENSKVDRSTLKSRILRDNLLPCQCAECGLASEWQSKPLVLVIDHINGQCNDNRLENLRFLCPNCNSQTPTFAGRNAGTVKVKTDTCACGLQKSVVHSACKRCANRKKATSKIAWPPLEELVKRLGNAPLSQLAKELGVSGNALKKHLTKRNMGVPGRSRAKPQKPA